MRPANRGVTCNSFAKCNSRSVSRRPTEPRSSHRVDHAGDYNFCHYKNSGDTFYTCQSCSSADDLSESELDRRLLNWFDCWDVFDFFSQIQISKYAARVERDMGRPPTDNEMRYIRKMATAEWEARPLAERRRYLAELTHATARAETERERARVAQAAARTRDWAEQHFHRQARATTTALRTYRSTPTRSGGVTRSFSTVGSVGRR